MRPPESFPQESSHRKHKLSADFNRGQRYNQEICRQQRPEIQTFHAVTTIYEPTAIKTIVTYKGRSLR